MFLDDLKDTVSSVGSQIGEIVGSGVVNKVQTEVSRYTGNGSQAGVGSAPAPSVPDYYAKMQSSAGSFFNSKVAGVPVPLLIAAGLGAILLLRRR